MGRLFKLKHKIVKYEGVQWIYLAHNGIQLSDLVNTINKSLASIKEGSFVTS